MSKKLIVNADDYGHTPGVSAGIRQAHLQGIVTSTTAMMNRPDAVPAIRTALAECPRLGLGVHLVLTAGEPLLSLQQVPDLVDSTGHFLDLDTLVDKLDTLDLEQVWAEWNAQVELFTHSADRPPDHLDSHHHCSYFTPGLFELMCRLAEQLDCPIRKPYSEDPAEAALYLPPSLVDRVTPGYLDLEVTSSPQSTEKFFGDFFAEGATHENLFTILENIRDDPQNSTFELMCHPAVVDDTLRRISDYNILRASELEILLDDAVKTSIRIAGIELINYAQL